MQDTDVENKAMQDKGGNHISLSLAQLRDASDCVDTDLAICTELGLDASSRPRSTVHGIENQFALERKQGNELMAKLSHEDGRVLKEIQASWPYDRAQEGRHLPIRADDVDDD